MGGAMPQKPPITGEGIIPSTYIEGADVFNRFLVQVPEHMKRAMRAALLDSTKLVKKEVSRRVVIPQYINKQDAPESPERYAGDGHLAPGRTGIVYYEMHPERLEGKVGVKPRWYFASGRVSGAPIYRDRTSLLCKRVLFRYGAQQVPVRVPFTKPKMLRWAQSHDQVRCKQVFLGRGDERLRQISDTEGVVSRVLPTIEAFFSLAVSVATAALNAASSLGAINVGNFAASTSPAESAPADGQSSASTLESA